MPFGVPRSPSPHRVPVISSSAGRFYQETLLGSDARPAQPPRPCEVLIALGSMDVVFTGFHVEPSSRPCAEPRSVAVSGAVSPWPTRLAVPGRGFPRLPRETCSSLRRLRPSFSCCGYTGLAVWVTMGLLWYFVVVVF